MLLSRTEKVIRRWHQHRKRRQAGEGALKRSKRVFTALCTPHIHHACHMSTLPLAAAVYFRCLPWRDMTTACVCVLYMIYIQSVATFRHWRCWNTNERRHLFSKRPFTVTHATDKACWLEPRIPAKLCSNLLNLVFKVYEYISMYYMDIYCS